MNHFHTTREIFREVGIHPEGFSLPCQHSLVHYHRLIQEYGAPNGLCSSITESRHITAVKKPWRHSNKYEALGQMLITNQRLDKISALRADFINHKMLPPTHTPSGQTHVTTVSGQHDQRAIEGEDINESNMADIEAVEDNVVVGNVSVGRRSGMQF